MSAWRAFVVRCRDFAWPRAAQRRRAVLDEEMRAHLDALAADYRRRGLSPDDARAAARRDFGGVTQIQEAWDDVRGFPWLANAGRDLRLALRLVRRQPVSALTSVLSLGIAIGGATAMYLVIDALFYRPLAVTRPHELVSVEPQIRDRRWILPNPIYERLRAESQSVTGIAAVNDVQFMRARLDDGSSAFVQASLVSGSYFSVLGVSPALGRLIDERDDETPEASSCAAVLGHAYWVRQFHADPSVLGRHLRANAADCVIVGVTPAAFGSHLAGYAPELWLPLRPLTSRRNLENYFGAFFSGVIGRLKPGVGAGEAARELTATYQRIHHDVPAARGEQPIDPSTVSIRLSSGAFGLGRLREAFGRALAILAGFASLVLIVAAINVANVTLARGLARQQELATRRALGAGPARLVAQLCAEGAVIVGSGVLTGLAIAAVLAPVIASFVTLDYQTITLGVVPSFRAALFVGAAATLLVVIVAALPAYRLVRFHGNLAAPVRSATDAPAAQRTLRSLVVAQLALAFLLVVASGLLVRTLFRLSNVDPGFHPDRVLVLNLGGDSRFNASAEDERMRRAAVLRDLQARIQALPGVEAAAISWLGLFGGSDLWMRYKLDARDVERRTARVDYVSPEYFDVLGMRVLRGRTFRDEERPGGRRPAVINESMARQRFGGEAIGREFLLDTPADTGVPFVVIGVVADSKYNDLRETTAEPMAWLPLADVGGVAMRSITIRAAPGLMADVTDGVRRVLASVNPDLLIRRPAALSDLIVETRKRERLLFGLSIGLGAVALLLAALGMYGMLSQTLARRRREMGVRLALGAPPAALRRMILTSAAWLVLAALVLAVPLAIAAAGALRSFLFGVQPTDVATLVSSALFVVALALAAAYLPARRAAGVDPLEIIRGE